MAIVAGTAVETIVGGSFSSGTWNSTVLFTVVAGQNLLTVRFSGLQPDSNISSVTYNGVALTSRAAVNSSSSSAVSLWDIVNPSVGTSQPLLITFTNGNVCDSVVQAASGVDTTSPRGTPGTYGNFNVPGTPSLTLVTVVGDWVVDVIVVENGKTLTPNAGQTTTSLNVNPSGSLHCATSSIMATTTSTTVGWTESLGDFTAYAAIGYHAGASPSRGFMLSGHGDNNNTPGLFLMGRP